MGDITDEQIERVVIKALDERRKRNVNKIFRDPVKSESIVMYLAIALVFTTMMAVFAATLPHSSFSSLNANADDIKYEKIVLSHQTCSELKSTLHDINQNTGFSFDNLASDYKTEISARC